MNKLLKGSIAGAAGVALLIGGAGTFALWNDTAAIDGGTITAGTLDVATGDGAWSDQFGGIESINSYRIVPGDTLTYKTLVTVVAEGDNLSAELSVNDRYITAGGGTAGAALKGYLKESTTLTVVDEHGSLVADKGPKDPKDPKEPNDPKDGPAVLKISPSDGSHTYDVTVTITFPAGVTGGAENASKTGSVNLNDFGVTLNQVVLPVS